MAYVSSLTCSFVRAKHHRELCWKVVLPGTAPIKPLQMKWPLAETQPSLALLRGPEMVSPPTWNVPPYLKTNGGEKTRQGSHASRNSTRSALSLSK